MTRAEISSISPQPIEIFKANPRPHYSVDLLRLVRADVVIDYLKPGSFDVFEFEPAFGVPVSPGCNPHVRPRLHLRFWQVQPHVIREEYVEPREEIGLVLDGGFRLCLE